MKKLSFFISFLGLGLVLSQAPERAFADEYDDSQSHPLRIVAYTVHPIGVLLEWTLLRPAHFIVSLKGLDYLFGHKPHPPLFDDPQPDYDFGVSKRVPIERKAPPKEVGPQEPVAERVTIKEVFVEKVVPVERAVLREIPTTGEIPTTVEAETMVLPAVAFQFDSAKLTDLGVGKVYLVAQRLLERADTVIVIEGHTDQIGTPEYNKSLGLRRAEAVKQELIRLGIDQTRISVVSLGETRPFVAQDTDWARALNRRVEIKISTTP